MQRTNQYQTTITTHRHSPMTNCHILRGAQDVSRLGRAPCKPKPIMQSALQLLPLNPLPQKQTNSPLSRLPNKPNIRPTYTPPLWLTRMFRPIKHENLTRNRLGRNQIGVLWHIPSTVHLPIMVYPLDDLNPGRRGRRRKRVPP